MTDHGKVDLFDSKRHQLADFETRREFHATARGNLHLFRRKCGLVPERHERRRVDQSARRPRVERQPKHRRSNGPDHLYREHNEPFLRIERVAHNMMAVPSGMVPV